MPEPTTTPDPAAAGTRPVPASGTVHWVGAGLSNGRSGLALLADRAQRLIMWGRHEQRVTDRLDALGLRDRIEVAVLAGDALAGAVRAGDVVVSMLPASEHAGLLALCRDAGAHFACSSYTSEAIETGAENADVDGLVVLTESGLDPGIDHLMAHHLVSLAREAMGDRAGSVSFTSYCGGLPAVPNEFRYRFSWAPYGVLSALGSPSRYIAEGQERTSTHPWEATTEHRLDGEAFEVYPNRDSLPFVQQYQVPQGWQLETFVRGTLRSEGWLRAWQPVFETVRAGDTERLRALAGELAERYPTGPEDLDRVVLTVALDVRGARGISWRGEYRMDLTGSTAESAMARCVTLPLCHGITRILDGATPPGLHRGAEDPAEVERWLAFLAEQGLPLELHQQQT